MLAARRLLPLFFVTSCVVDVPDPHKGTFACKSDSDCVDGYKCSFSTGAGVCVSTGGGSSGDTSPPETSIDTRTPPEAQTTSQSITFKYSGTDNAGIAGFECALDSQSFQGCPGGSTGGQQSYNALSVGQHTFRVRARDTAGNVDGSPATHTWQVMSATGDTAPPETTITSVNPNQSQTTSTTISVSYSGTDNVGVVGFECALDTSGFSACSGGATGGSTTYTALTLGTHSVNVRARDAAGNVDPTPAAFSWTVVSSGSSDTTPPDTFITGQPPSVATTGDAMFYFNGSDNNQVTSLECRLDTAPFTTCATSSAGNISYSNLADGSHSFDVQAVDAAGNRDPTPAHVTWTVQRPDTTPPLTSLGTTPAALSRDRNPVFTYSCNETCSYTCRLDQGTTFACDGGSYAVSTLADGNHTFDVWAKDAAGNQDPTGKTYTWTVDATPPSITITFSPAAPSSNEPRTSIEALVSCVDSSGCAITTQVDADTPLTVTAGPTTVKRWGLVDGAHSLRVDVADGAGNTATDTRGWNVATTFTGVSTGPFARHTCGIGVDGALWCTGTNENNQVSSSGPRRIATRTWVQAGIEPFDTWIDVTAGSQFTCGVRTEGATNSIWCWGANYWGQLGIGTTTPASTPTRVTDGTYAFSKVRAGNTHTCAVAQNGVLYCWGTNADGELGLGTVTTYQNWYANAVAGNDWKDVAAGNRFTCAVKNAGGLYCWGSNWSGQLGTGDYTSSPSPVAILPAQSFAAVAAGAAHACALTTGGDLFCWGKSDWAQAGATTSATPTFVTGGWSAPLVAGSDHTCGLRAGLLECWGASFAGQRGTGTAVSGPAVVTVPATAAGAGLAHSCAVSAGALRCWGSREDGALGDGFIGFHPRPSQVSATMGFLTLVTGHSSTCAIDGASKAWCWGDDRSGQLGDELVASADLFADLEPQQVPVPAFDGSLSVAAITSGTRHACLLSGQGLYCAGANQHGELGLNSTAGTPVFTRDPTLTLDWLRVAAGDDFTCGVRGATGASRLQCWGRNDSGQLGNGTSGAPVLSPADVAFPSGGTAYTDWLEVSVGWWHGCAIRGLAGSRYLHCWGWSSNGQVGTGTANAYVYIPQDVWGGQNAWMSVSAGRAHTCGITGTGVSGNLYCWGQGGNGQLGDGTYTDKTSPLTGASLGMGWSAVSAGSYHTCGIRYVAGGMGSLWCWGDDSFGQIGLASGSAAVPTQIGTDADWVVVAAGWDHTCGIRYNGGAYTPFCWGTNDLGQLGTGDAWDPVP